MSINKPKAKSKVNPIKKKNKQTNKTRMIANRKKIENTFNITIISTAFNDFQQSTV